MNLKQIPLFELKSNSAQCLAASCFKISCIWLLKVILGVTTLLLSIVSSLTTSVPTFAAEQGIVYLTPKTDYILSESTGHINIQVQGSYGNTNLVIKYCVFAYEQILDPSETLCTKDDNGDYVKNDNDEIVGLRTVTIPNGSNHTPDNGIQLRLLNDNVDEKLVDLEDANKAASSVNNVKVELIPDTSNYLLAGPGQAIPILCELTNGRYRDKCVETYFRVTDDDVPLVKIEKIDEMGVAEDASAHFKVIVDIVPATLIEIPIFFTNLIGDFYKSDVSTTTAPANLKKAIFSSGSQNCDIAISEGPQCTELFDIIDENGLVTGGGSFTASLQQVAPSNYRVLGDQTLNPANTITVAVFDDVEPVAYIYVTDTDVTEGEDIELKFGIESDPGIDITFNYSIDQKSLNFIADSDLMGGKTVTSAEFDTSLTEFVETINTVDDMLDDEEGEIVITLETGFGYDVDDIRKTVTYQISDNDEPEISINLPRSPTPTLSFIEDTTDPTFVLSSNIAPWQPIDITFSSEGSTGDCLIDTRVTNFSGASPVNVNIIDDDEVDEIDCNITIMLTDDDSVRDNGYSVSSSADDITFTVEDDDESLVTFKESAIRAGFGESSDFQFILEVPNTPPNNLTITFEVTQANGMTNFLNSDARTAEITTNDTEVEVDILDDDDLDELETNITVTLLDDDSTAENGYSIPTVVSEQELTFSAFSDDGPLVSIIETQQSAWNESGKVAQFQINLEQMSNRPLTINYLVIETLGDFLEQTEDTPGTEQLEAGLVSKIVEIDLHDDEIDEADGVISANLMVGSNYRISETESENIITLDIADDDQEMVSIHLPEDNSGNEVTSVLAGEVIEFMLKREKTTAWNEIRVELSINTTGNPILWRLKTYQIIEADNVTAVYRVPTRNRGILENSSVTVSLLTGTDYGIKSSQNSVTVSVQSNSNQPTQDNDDRISVASSVVAGILATINSESSAQSAPLGYTVNDPIVNLVPKILISSNVSSVNEGEPITFRIVSKPSVPHHFQVEVKIIGNSIEPSQSSIVSINSSEPEAILVVQTKNYELPGEDRTITAVLQPGNFYQLGSDKSKTVTILDVEDRNKENKLVSNAISAVLPNVLSEFGSQTVNLIDDRFNHSLSNNGNDTFVLWNNTEITGILTNQGKAFSNDSFSMKSLLGSSSFSQNLVPDAEISNFATVWGKGNLETISGNTDEKQQSWMGDSFIGQLGLDARIGNEVLSGIAYTNSDAQVDFRNNQNEQLTFNIASNGYHPYLGWRSLKNGFKISVQSGHGVGKIKVDQENIFQGILDTQYHSIAINSSKNLISTQNRLTGDLSELNLQYNSQFLRQIVVSQDDFIDDHQMKIWHMDLLLEGKQSVNFFNNVSVDLDFSVGFKSDQLNDQLIFGTGVLGGFNLSYLNGLNVSCLGFVNIPYENQIRSGFEGLFEFDQNRNQSGIQVEVLGSYGNTNSADFKKSNIDNLSYLRSYSLNQPKINRNLVTEIGYGFPVLKGVGSFKPYSGFTLFNGLINDYQFGGVLNVGSKLEFETIFVNQFDLNGHSSRGIELKGNINW